MKNLSRVTFETIFRKNRDYRYHLIMIDLVFIREEKKKKKESGEIKRKMKI